MKPATLSVLIIAAACAPFALAQQGDGTDVSISTNVWKPAKVPADEAHIAQDTNGDGKADGRPRTVVNRSSAHGLAIHDGKLYLVTVKELFEGSLNADGSVGPLKLLAGDLPDAGQHANRTIAFGPDNMLYLSVGSTCNACNDPNPENATLLRATPDGKSRTIFASGLRNTIGFDWQPQTGELWGC